MSLFNRLLSLHGGNRPLEDFFTEIVAHLFTTSPETLFAWIDSLGLIDTGKYSESYVSTQRAFDPLPNAFSGSRPDMLIEASDGHQQAWVVIESKIGSSERPEQLRGYAELLAAQPDLGDRWLIYITREYDPKKEHKILAGLPSVQFIQMRWHSFYIFLQQQPPTILTNEICQFMEEHGMAQSNQFTAADILTLSNLHNIL